LRLVGVTDNERGRARERTAKPTGLGGGAVGSQKPSSPVVSTHAEVPVPTTVCSRLLTTGY
jgi:hypothetical protein